MKKLLAFIIGSIVFFPIVILYGGTEIWIGTFILKYIFKIKLNITWNEMLWLGGVLGYYDLVRSFLFKPKSLSYEEAGKELSDAVIKTLRECSKE